MADIYLSYSRWDRARIAPIVSLLEHEGWSVWRDTRAGAGEAWDKTAAGEADTAACVIVAWSVSAADSKPVRAEARAAFERGVLVPVLLEQATPPHLFSALPAADLSGWNGEPDAPEARAFVAAVRKTAGVPGLWPAAKAARGAPEIEDWDSVQASRTPADFENFLSLHPKGPLAEPARARLEQLQLFDSSLVRPASSNGTARLWLLATVLLAIAGASTWYSFDPRFAALPAIEVQSGPDAAAPVETEPEALPEPAAAPPADEGPLPTEPPAPPAEDREGYKPFGDKTNGCPAEEFACRSTPGCMWWAAFNICVAQESGAEVQAPQDETPAPPPAAVPQCPVDQATCVATAGCEWVGHFKACLPTQPPAAEAPAQASPDMAQCAAIGDQAACSAEPACEWIVDQCFEKAPAPE